MDAPASPKALYVVVVLLTIFDLLYCVHSQVVDCGSLTDPTNGHVTHTKVRNTATYSCNTGYNLVGNSTRTCQAVGNWSGSEPTCEGDVWFSLNGTTYQNNSNVTLEDIGENDTALLCMTNLNTCCQPPHTGSNGSALETWSFPNGSRVLSSGDFYETRGDMVVLLHRKRGGVEGIYRCEIPDSRNVIQTIFIGVYSASTGDVRFSLNGTTYQNNSVVTLEDIGNNSDTALLCMTDLTACCRPSHTNGSSLGNWYFPNETRVPNEFINETIWDFYRDRDLMVGPRHSVGSPNVTSLTFNVLSTSLTCTSTGGPATTVTWRRDGIMITLNATYQQTKRIVDNVTSTYQTVLTIDPSVGQSDIVGTYNCTVENDRGESSETVTVTGAGKIRFSLNGTTYQNNSLVTLEGIGKNDTALLCMTDLTPCCRPPYTGTNGTSLGNWFFPNGSRVDNKDVQLDFYRDREQMVVQMNRRRGGVNGIYRCEIPDLTNITRTVYIGVYNPSTGSPIVTSLMFDVRSTSLTCTSTGGPATTVTWRRDGVVITLNTTHQQTKRLVDAVNSAYQTVLTIDPSVDQSGIVGTYSCTVKNDRGKSSKTVDVPVGVWFSLNGTTYQNNSLVTLEDIGENHTALLCMTSLTACCQRPYTGINGPALGNWFFPNGTRVPSSMDHINGGSTWDIYRTREQMVVYMHRRRDGEDGIYRCEIPDSLNVTQSIYIGVYTAASTGSPIVTSLTYDVHSTSLTCTSTGGPATTVTWRRDGVVITLNATYQQTKRLVDAETGTYQTVLTINSSVGWSDIVGTYNCTVENDRGEFSETVVVPGDVWFSLNGMTYQNNSIVSLEDIGKEDDTALLCITNKTDCCRPPQANGSSLGNWYFPNETRVPSDFIINRTIGLMWDFYRDRDQMVVRMKRRRGGEEGIYRCDIPDSMNVAQTIYIGVYTAASTGSPNVTTLIYDGQSRTLTCTSTGGPATTVTWRRDGVVIALSDTYQQTKRLVDTVNSTYQTVLTIDPSVGWSDIVGTYNCTVENVRGESSETVVVPAIPQETTPPQTQPTNDLPSDGTTTTSVIIVVAVVIILVVIVVGVVILVVIFRTKKRKEQLVISKFHSVTTENEDFEMKLKQEETIEKEANSNANQPPYAEVQTKVPPDVPSKSEELVEYLNRSCILASGYSEIQLEASSGEHALHGKPPRYVSLLHPMPEDKEPSPMHQNMDQSSASPSITSVSQGKVIYTEPQFNSAHTVEPDSETVYSEPIQPSLFTDAISDCEDLQPYAPIYTIPTSLPKSEQRPLNVFGSNIREIHELGLGLFGKVILAETVGLSAKELRLSESDDDKSKSTLVTVKKLKSDAPNATKEAFEKEVNFMSRLTDRNVIRILGVCYEDTPFIMMEYMEKGDLHQYLQKFKTMSTTDSEPQGQITTSTLVHIATQIASAMKYLASHNFVHRDLATRNCLVGPNYLVKISDFGMSRSLYDSHYYRIQGSFVLPVRWMAFECFYGKFSQKSDVWAFGVTMWEIFTLAKEQPYNDMSDKQMIEDALKGKNRKLLVKPDMCPLEVYKIMLECWAHDLEQRATFEKLFQLLTSIHNNVLFLSQH